jgi:NAD(P)-dependent dehydrogenase (short-subunit alcohol dehydrogenase family)
MLHAGKVAIVTGGSTGIGRAASLAFAREGAAVVIGDINDADGELTAQMIRDAGGKARFVHTDVTKSTDVQAMVACAVDEYGGLDTAFNNAGVNHPIGTVETVSEEDWNRAVAINMTSIYLCMKYEIPVMRQRGGGAIVNTSSGMGLFALPGVAAYVATKHAVIGLTKSAAIDFGPENIRVNALLPGKTLTELTRRSYANLGLDLDQVAGGLPLRRLGLPQDQAEAVVWLCSDRAAFVTGLSLIVDGGEAAQR